MIMKDWPQPDADDFLQAMRHLASGVSLITTRNAQGMPLGMLATAVSSVSAEPPLILVCINRSASLHNSLIEAGVFCVNFLADHHRDILRRFGSTADRDARFDGGTYHALTTGVPVLTDAHAALDCEVSQVVPSGSHSVVFGRVLATSATPEGASSPLVHHGRQFGRWTTAD